MLNHTVLPLFGAFLLVVATAADAATPADSFRKSYPNIPVESVTPTEIPGLYEIVSGGRIAYYAPGPEYIVYGPMVTREGRNLTDERMRELLERKLKEVPLANALRIGSGPRQVIEITDPDCSFCRKASAFFAERSDVTRHIFFFPLSIHKDAEAKVRYILGAADRAKAYHEAMTGKLDDMKFKRVDDEATEKLVRAHREITARIGVSSTPLFLVEGRVVMGADLPLIEKLLAPKK